MGTKNVLKKIVLAVFGFALVVIFSSCSQDELVNQEDQDIENLISKDDQEKIDYIVKEFGADPKEVFIFGNDIIVENDICFDRNNFWEKYSQDSTIPQLKSHYQYGINLIVTKQYRKILIMADANVPQEWLLATLEAIKAWNDLGGPIKFTTNRNDSYGSRIDIKYASLSKSTTFAGAERPSGGKPGSRIRVNSTYQGQALSAENRKWTIAHELGHAIGFAHTDPDSGEETFRLLPIEGCQGTDSESVMRQGFKDSGFTECDKKAYKNVYWQTE